MECPLARQQHANCPDRLEGNKGDSFSQASEKCGLLVVIRTPVGRGRPKDTFKPLSVGGLGIEGEARCGPVRRFRRIANAVAAGGLCATTSH